MQSKPTCTVAQLLFVQPPPLHFARLVADLDAAFDTCPIEGRSLQWDHEDIAILDVQGSRIIIGYDATLTGDHRACLSIGVGYGPGDGLPGLAQRQDTVSRMIADRIAQRYQPDASLWHHSALPLGPALLDELIDTLPATSVENARREAARRAGMARLRAGMQRAPALALPDATQPLLALPGPLPALVPANDCPDLPQAMQDELARVREALYHPDDMAVVPSTALRLAAHAVNATLVCIALPVGAAMMTYSLMRGENFNASARLMAIIGIAIGAREAGLAQDMLPWV